MNAIRPSGKVAMSTVEALKTTPMVLAFLAINVTFIAFAAYILGEVATNSRERSKLQVELIGNLIKECHK